MGEATTAPGLPSEEVRTITFGVGAAASTCCSACSAALTGATRAAAAATASEVRIESERMLGAWMLDQRQDEVGPRQRATSKEIYTSVRFYRDQRREGDSQERG